MKSYKRVLNLFSLKSLKNKMNKNMGKNTTEKKDGRVGINKGQKGIEGRECT
jgi:hypothetical protein